MYCLASCFYTIAVATKIQLPHLEDSGLDVKKLYTPNEWNEKFRHYIQRIHNIDIKQILTDDKYLPVTHGIQKNQKSDKISSGAPNSRQSRLS